MGFLVFLIIAGVGIAIWYANKERQDPNNVTQQGQEPYEKTTSVELRPIRQTSVPARTQNLIQFSEWNLHPDVKGLLWFGDGNFKNYSIVGNKAQNFNTVDFSEYGFTVTFSVVRKEPSVIETTDPILEPKDKDSVPRPPYYPEFGDISPEQRWIYAKFLTNPYDPSVNIGYVFIFYYGLERHLLQGNFDKAFEVILKLRDVHTNKSFQSYSANAIILSCLAKGTGQYIPRFIESFDKDHELNFSSDLLLICYYSFDFSLKPEDVMRMAKSFEFNNMNYIKKEPELFRQCLSEVITVKLGTSEINISKYLTKSEFNKLQKQEVPIFANMSLIEQSVQIPIITSSFKLKHEMYNFLESAHELTKKKLAERRKAEKAASKQAAT